MGVTITLVPVDGSGSPPPTAAQLPLLCGRQQLRARAMAREEDRQRYVLCQAAILSLARTANGGAPVSSELLPSGRLRLSSGLRLSVSRAGGRAALALCDEHDIGVDLESVETILDWRKAAGAPGLATRLGSGGAAGKLAVLRAWTELEAIAKLRQIPLQHLLESREGQACVVRSFAGREMVLCLAAEHECAVTLELAAWEAGGKLVITRSETWPAQATGSCVTSSLLG